MHFRVKSTLKYNHNHALKHPLKYSNFLFYFSILYYIHMIYIKFDIFFYYISVLKFKMKKKTLKNKRRERK